MAVGRAAIELKEKREMFEMQAALAAKKREVLSIRNLGTQVYVAN